MSMTTDVGALSPPKFYRHFHPAHEMTLLQAVAHCLNETVAGDLNETLASAVGAIVIETAATGARNDVIDGAFQSHRQKALWLVEFGAVYVDQLRVIDPGHPVKPDQLVRVHLKPKRYIFDREELSRRVVFENDDFMVVNKISGIPMHATLDNLYENLLAGFDQPLHVTHRLDVPTSGLVLVAKTKEYQSLFNKVVANREIEKIYEALTQQPVPVGLHQHLMLKSVRAPKEMVTEVPAGGATTNYETCRLIVESCVPSAAIYRSTIKLLTGRTHQIRAQLRFLGASILGDEMYGGIPHEKFGLHASALRFVCPKTHNLFSFN